MKRIPREYEYFLLKQIRERHYWGCNCYLLRTLEQPTEETCKVCSYEFHEITIPLKTIISKWFEERIRGQMVRYWEGEKFIGAQSERGFVWKIIFIVREIKRLIRR